MVSELVMKQAKEALVEMSSTWRGGGVTMGRAWDLKGEELAGQDFTACHAWLTHTYTSECFSPGYDWNRPYDKKARDFLCLTAHSKVRSKGVCKMKAHEALILWLASPESPVSQFILNSDDKDSLTNGGAIILCGPSGATLSQAMWICKVLRYAVEGSQSIDTWHELHKAGVNPLLALVVATFVRTVTGAKFGFTGPDNHVSVFRTDYNEASFPYDVKKIMQGVLYADAVDTSEVFGKRLFRGVTLPIQDFCAPIQVSDGWGGTTLAAAASKDLFIERVKQWEKELQGDGFGKPEKPKRPTKDTVYLEVDM
jgi:hypothetical protein